MSGYNTQGVGVRWTAAPIQSAISIEVGCNKSAGRVVYGLRNKEKSIY
jgi:hypothetical protein